MRKMMCDMAAEGQQEGKPPIGRGGSDGRMPNIEHGGRGMVAWHASK